MANTLKPILPYAVTNAFTTVYEVPSVTKFTVSNIHISNITGSSATIELCLVDAVGTTATSATALLWDLSIPANDIFEFGKGLMFPAGATLKVKAPANSTFIITVSGIETT